MTRPPPGISSTSRRSVLRGLAALGVRALGGTGAALLVAPRAARASAAELTSFDVVRDEDGVYVNYNVDFELGKTVDDALVKAVPIFFVADAAIFRSRWYWRDRRVAHAVRVWKIVFQPLTTTYRVTTVGGLSQNYATREEALGAIARATRWKVAEPAQLEEGARHYIEFSFRLDVALLPRPMQIGVGGQPDWQLAVQRSQRIN